MLSFFIGGCPVLAARRKMLCTCVATICGVACDLEATFERMTRAVAPKIVDGAPPGLLLRVYENMLNEFARKRNLLHNSKTTRYQFYWCAYSTEAAAGDFNVLDILYIHVFILRCFQLIKPSATFYNW